MLEIMYEPQAAPSLRTVIALHRRNPHRPLSRAELITRKRRLHMRFIRRQTTGDRLDAGAERKFRREQTPAEREEERLFIIAWETDARHGKRHAEDSRPYAGSELEREHRRER